MTESEAIDLMRGAAHRPGGVWADLGAGEGTFTRALAAVLGPGARIYAVDRDARALARLKRRARSEAVELVTVEADLTQAFDLPGLDPRGLDGILIANALHYASDPALALARFAKLLTPGGRLVLVEYDRRSANRWVPYPITPPRFRELASAVGLTDPVVTARRPSAFGGDLYVAVADLLPAEPLARDRGTKDRS